MIPYNKNLKERSRELRANMTNAEKRLWGKINQRQLKGCQFYRQKPIGDYIVDFFCLKAKLAIEVDGGQHLSQDARANDRLRDEYLRSLGISVLRFKNREALMNIEGVVERIKSKIPLCPPLRKGER